MSPVGHLGNVNETLGASVPPRAGRRTDPELPPHVGVRVTHGTRDKALKTAEIYFKTFHFYFPHFTDGTRALKTCPRSWSVKAEQDPSWGSHPRLWFFPPLYGVLVSLSCPNQVPQAGWLKTKGIHLSQFGGLGSPR